MSARAGRKVKQGSGAAGFYAFIPVDLPPQNSAIQCDAPPAVKPGGQKQLENCSLRFY